LAVGKRSRCLNLSFDQSLILFSLGFLNPMPF